MTTGASVPRGIRLALDDGPAIDPFALAGADGLVFATEDRVLVGLGRALTIELPSGLERAGDLTGATARLGAIEVEDRLEGHRPGGGRLEGRSAGWRAPVLAFGSLPFDRQAPGVLLVPEILYAREADGVEWATVLTTGPGVDRSGPPTSGGGLRAWLSARSDTGPAPAQAPRIGGGPHVGGGPHIGGQPRIDPRTSDERFLSMVGEALGAIERGEMAKVVLARQIDVSMPEAIDIVGLLTRWQELEPACALFSVPTAAGQFVGASPELLVERKGDQVRSRPLAGTSERSATAESGRSGGDDRFGGGLLRSRKDGNEHRLVVEAIAEALGPLCTELHVPTHPDLVHLRSITHLGTSMTGRLAPTDSGGLPSALDLVGDLHPTPAVGGAPRRPALALLSELEGADRGHFAGPVGYVDSDGDGTWMVGIRAMTIRGAEARLAAGVGIVPGSDPRSELAETCPYARVSGTGRSADRLRPGHRPTDHPDQSVRIVPGHEVTGPGDDGQCGTGDGPGQGGGGLRGDHQIPCTGGHLDRHGDRAEQGGHGRQIVDQGPLLDEERPPAPAPHPVLVAGHPEVGQ